MPRWNRRVALLVTLALASGWTVAGQGGQAGQGRDPQQGRAGGAGQQAGQPTRDTQTQKPVVGTGVIAGAVVTAGTGTAVRRARVSLSGAELRGARSMMTDNDGRFAFTALPAGRFTLTASKPGYVDLAYGAKRPGRPGTPIQLADGQKLEKAHITLPRGGVVTGIVIDEHGEPSPGTQVRALRYAIRTGEKTLQQAGSDQTDDRGMYRIFQLQPGDYIVSASPRNTNLGDVRERVLAEIEAVTQELQAARGAGAGGGRGGGGGGGGLGRAGEQLSALSERLAGGGRGQQAGDRLAQLQQQLEQQNQEQAVAYAPVYYPGTTSPGAAVTVTLGVSEERAGVDFQLQLVPTSKVEGSVMAPDGSPPQGTQVALVPANQGMPTIPGVGMNQTRVNQQGRFTFTGVIPGQYTLMARAPIRQAAPATPAGAAAQVTPAGRGGRAQGPGQGPGGRGGPATITQVLWASTDVTVTGESLSDLVLNLQSGMTVSGRLSFEGSVLTPPGDLTRARVSIAPRGQQLFEMGGMPPAQVDASGRFTIMGVAPGRYTIQANVPANAGPQAGGGGLPAGQGAGQWTLKSSVANGRDTLDFPLEIRPNEDVSGALVTFTDRAQELSGTLQDAAGQPTAEYTIIVFPTDERFWVPQARRIASARPGTDGKFSVRNLPAGDYRLTAVTDVEPGEWYDPAFLSQLVGASIPITLTEGAKKVQDIKVAR